MYKDKNISAIIVAAGKGTRIGFDKMLYKIQDKQVISHSINAFQANEYVDEIIVVAGDNIEKICCIAQQYSKVVKVTAGGDTRAQSVLNGVLHAKNNSLIAIHDGARPFVSDSIICDTVKKAYQYHAAVPCVAVKDTIKQGENDNVAKTLPRETLFITQTPQIFDRDLYIKFSKEFYSDDITDDAQLFERAGHIVKMSCGEYENYKITTIDDIKKEKNMRIGHGYDVHKLVNERKLIIGGVDIPYEKGLLGHSDADVLLHAVMDSLLGALALGDIGKHFPDSDPKYKGADSLKLLQHVASLLEQKNAKVENIDATILCQKPKLAPYIITMRKNIANALNISEDKVSVKATTEEGLGFTGEGLGIACHSVCLVNF